MDACLKANAPLDGTAVCEDDRYSTVPKDQRRFLQYGGVKTELENSY
jgi:hypothetical protein